MTWGELTNNGLPPCVAVINVAGQNVLDPTRRWTEGFKQNVWASRVNTTKSLAKAICSAKKSPRVFATISGAGYYKPSATDEYMEDSPGGDFDFLSKLCSDWEAASHIPSDLSTRRVSIRAGVVLGRQGGMIAQLIWPFFFGLGGRVGTGTQYMPWIHIQDIARLFQHVIENEITGVLNGVAPQVITNAEFAKAFARHLWRPALLPLPTLALNLAFSEERAKIMTEGQKVIPKRTLQSGFKFKFSDIDSACNEFSKLIYADNTSV